MGVKDHVTATLTENTEHAPVDPTKACLSDGQITELAHIALNVEKYFGYPVDIEWGLLGGKFVLLQSRARCVVWICGARHGGGADGGDRAVEAAGDGGRGRERRWSAEIWIVHNLSETLGGSNAADVGHHARFMAGNGGFREMYKDFGAIGRAGGCATKGFLELICGRIYVDAKPGGADCSGKGCRSSTITRRCWPIRGSWRAADGV